MNVLLLMALACLVSAAEEPLPPSGDFNTIYLASKYVSVTEENSQFRILMREVKFFKNYKLMNMTFYVRKNEKCQLHTVQAVQRQPKDCTKKRYRPSIKCPIYNGTKKIIGQWALRDAHLHFPSIYYHSAPQGGLSRRPSLVYFGILFVLNTNILLEVRFLNNMGYKTTMMAALARGTNVTAEVWEEYVKLIHQKNIPIENIENVSEADACPKWKHGSRE